MGLMEVVLQTIRLADIGILLSAVAGFGVYYLRLHNRRQSLRIALLEELKEPGDALTNIESIPVLPDEDFIPTEIYESVAGDLGILSENEVRKTVRYYTVAFRLKNQLNDPDYQITIPKWYYEELHEEKQDEDFRVEDLAGRVHPSDEPHRAVKRARNLNCLRKEAIEEIESKISK